MVKRQDPKDLSKAMLPFGALSGIGKAEDAGAKQPARAAADPGTSRSRGSQRDPAPRGAGTERTSHAIAQQTPAPVEPTQSGDTQSDDRKDITATAEAEDAGGKRARRPAAGAASRARGPQGGPAPLGTRTDHLRDAAQPALTQVTPAQVGDTQEGPENIAAKAAAAVAAPARTQAREIADRRLHVMITDQEMDYLRDVARRKAGELGRVFGDSASIGQVIRYLIHFHRQSEGR